MKYLEMPWGVEDTIENLKEVKELLQLNVITKNLHGLGEKDAEEIEFDFDRAIKALEENVNKWIPCSERLPEENVPVLTCDKNGWISVNVNIPYFGNRKNDFECGYYLAWMPLPEPYKPEV